MLETIYCISHHDDFVTSTKEQFVWLVTLMSLITNTLCELEKVLSAVSVSVESAQGILQKLSVNLMILSSGCCFSRVLWVHRIKRKLAWGSQRK